MTAIADAELQRLFSQYQKQVYDLGMAMMSQTSGDVTRDMANHWAGEAHDAFCAALNERLEAADRMALAIAALLDDDGAISCQECAVVTGPLGAQASNALAAYRQSKERT